MVPSVGFDTLTWTLQNGATLTWNAQLDDMLPGERREVALGATVDFVYSATPGSIELPEIAVAAEQILAIDPPLRTVAPGVTTSYDLTVAPHRIGEELRPRGTGPATGLGRSTERGHGAGAQRVGTATRGDTRRLRGTRRLRVFGVGDLGCDRGLGVGDARGRRSRRFPAADAGRGGRRRRAHSRRRRPAARALPPSSSRASPTPAAPPRASTSAACSRPASWRRSTRTR